MSDKISAETGSDWNKFLRKHRKIFAIFAVASILAIAGAVYVFVWFAGNAQSTKLAPSILGLWTMGNLVAFILYAIFWELLLIGVPAAIAAVVGWQWWKRLPVEEKREYNLFRSGSRSSRASGVISPLLFIAFAIKVYVDGNWNAAISAYTLNYVVGSIVTILIWIAVIFGIPIAIGTIWWIHHVVKKTP